MVSMALANPEINWYTSYSDRTKSVLEVCIEDECHRLVHDTENSDKAHITEWALEMIEANKKINYTKKVYNDKR